MKYVVKCRAGTGEIIHEYSQEAKSRTDAHMLNHRHPEYAASMMKALEKGIRDFHFVIYPLNEMN